MTDEAKISLADALNRVADILERLEQRLGDEPLTGDKHDAAKLLKISIRTLNRRKEDWIEGVHYWHEGGKLVFNLELLRDWQANRNNPQAHQRAIENWRTNLPSNQKRIKRRA